MLVIFYVLFDVRDPDGSNDCRIANNGDHSAMLGETDAASSDAKPGWIHHPLPGQDLAQLLELSRLTLAAVVTAAFSLDPAFGPNHRAFICCRDRIVPNFNKKPNPANQYALG